MLKFFLDINLFLKLNTFFRPILFSRKIALFIIRVYGHYIKDYAKGLHLDRIRYRFIYLCNEKTKMNVGTSLKNTT